MTKTPLWLGFLISSYSSIALCVPILEFDVTAFTNMEHGFQITNRGYVATIRDANNRLIGGGPMTIEAAIAGKRIDPGAESFAPILRLRVELTTFNPQSGNSGQGNGLLSACMPENPQAPYEELRCMNLPSNLNDSSHDDRNHQLIDVPVDYTVAGETISVTKYNIGTGYALRFGLSDGATTSLGREGSAKAIAASVAHPVNAPTIKDKSFVDAQSPLVLDLNHDGKINLIDVWDKNKQIHFDIEGDGKASLTGWVEAEDGLLAIDRTGDGSINDGRELFGEYSFGIKVSKRSVKRFANGFEALAQYDNNQDGKISAADPGFKYLRIWCDKNSNGKSEAAELKPLSFYKIKELPLAFRSLDSSDGFPVLKGNQLRQVGRYIDTNNQNFPMIDVWFKQRRNPSKK